MQSSRSYNPFGSRYSSNHVCGCYYFNTAAYERIYLPQVKLDVQTTILATASRTVLRQTFVNYSTYPSLDEIRYAFPLFDSVSVVEFSCQIGERTIYGLVKEKREARKTYEAAKQRGENAALLEQLPDAADVFTTAISNIPSGSSVHVTIKYVQELKHDAEVDGIRLTIPTSISPRYNAYPGPLQQLLTTIDPECISITVDVSMAEGVPIRKLISPSHPIAVTFGSLSTSTIHDDPSVSKASATFSLSTMGLDKDFVLQVVAKDIGIPQAILETHPTLFNQRALMTTLVPKFNLKAQTPEIIFIADRSGSMQNHIPTLVSALKVFLKSIPVGCRFNICSFGSGHQLLWEKSRLYNQDTLAWAMQHIDTFSADFGGTETLAAVKACCEARHEKLQTELMLLTDGDIWSQQELFDYISTQTNTGEVRVFPIGIGGGVSTALIEGVARAGRGFAQMVTDNERLDSKIVRMLKGALTPHIKDYRLEVKYEDDSIESVSESLRVRLNIGSPQNHDNEKQATPINTKSISLFDPDYEEELLETNDSKDPFAGLPPVDHPNILQSPHEIPALFPFNRTCVYLLLSANSSHLKPKSVVLKGTAPQGPLELEIPIQIREHPDEMIHQLAARKATQELEEGHGWLSDATLADTNEPLKDTHEAHFALLQRREAVRLGVEFQVGGKFCSFVAVEANEAEIAEERKAALEKVMVREGVEDGDWEVVSEDVRSSAFGIGGRARMIKPAFNANTVRACPSDGGLFAGMGRQQNTGAVLFGDAAPQQNTGSGFTSAGGLFGGRAGQQTGGLFGSGQQQTGGLFGSQGQQQTGGLFGTMAQQQNTGSSLFGGLGQQTQQHQQEEVALAPSTVPAGRGQGGGLFSSLRGGGSTQGSPNAFSSGRGGGRGGAFGQPSFGGASLFSAPQNDQIGGASLFSGPFQQQSNYQTGGASLFSTSHNDQIGGASFFSSPFQQSNNPSLLPSSSSPFAQNTNKKQNLSPFSSPNTILHHLIAQQSFSGSLPSAADLPCEAMRIDRVALADVLKKLGVAEEVLCTAVFVVFLERKMAGEEETWELVVQKARRWLEDNVERSVLDVVLKEAGVLVGV